MVFLCLCLPARPSRLERRTPPHALDHSPGHRGRPEPDRGRQWPDFAERQALAVGHSCIRLYTHEAMSENIALYTRRGYTKSHRAEEHRLRQVYMSKALD
ncbi:acetyltransferase, GNAT family [Pseudomonas chlororaphis subsp. aurantiaca]|nr:acetyltransferase, GNAT family [Pseudomonas chlororaphis subsp. aurantiaca]